MAQPSFCQFICYYLDLLVHFSNLFSLYLSKLFSM